MAQSSEIKLLKRFDQDVEITGTLEVGGNAVLTTTSVASGITSTDISNWNTAYGWGNHADAGYITSVPTPDLDLQDVTDNSATTDNYITSSADTSGQTYGNFTASGTEDWYMFALGSRGASAGAYGIGLKNTITDRTLSIHVPNQSAYGSTGAIPQIGFYSNGAVELFTVKSDTGDSYVRGKLAIGAGSSNTPDYPLDVNGAGFFASDGNHNNRVLFLRDHSTNTGNIIQFLKNDNTFSWEVVGRENGFYIYNNMLSNYAMHINESTSNVSIGAEIDKVYKLHIYGSNQYLLNLNNSTTDPRLQFQRSGSSLGHISAGGGLFTMYGEAGTALRFMPNGSSAMTINTDGSTSFIQGATSIPTGGISHYTNNYLYIKGGTAGLAIGDDSFSSSVYCVDNGNVEINTQGSIAMVIGTNKNVGIRVSSPEAGVDINTGTDSAQADWSSGTIPYGTEKADLVLTRRHSATKDGNLGFAGALIDFRATNTTNEWSTAQIVSTIDPNGGSGHSGGLHFLTSAGGSTDPSGRRNQGGAPAVRMSIDTQGRVGIGRYNPSYKLDIGGNLRIGASTNAVSFNTDGIYTAMYADGVLRIRQRVEVWGEGTSGRQYLDVRDTDGSVKVKLDAESTSYFTRNVAIGATSATSALLISGTGVGAAIDFANTTATTGRNYRLVSLNAGGFALEDQTSATTPFTVSSGGDATFNAKLTAALDIKGQRLILRSDALERWEGTGDDKAVTINYFGYNSTFDYYRDLNIYNGKGGFIATFDGSTSRLGIGTTSPRNKLQVEGNIEFGNWTTAGSRYIGYSRQDNGAFGTAGASGLEIESGNFGGAGNYDQKVHVWTHTYNGGSDRRLTVDNYGRVGIGTTSPLNKLSVVARNNSGYYLDNSSTVVIQDYFPTLLIAHDANDTDHYSELRLGNNHNQYFNRSAFIRGVQGGGINQYRLEFGTSNISTATTKMTLDFDGRLGIGRSPSYKLDVAGDARVTTSIETPYIYGTSSSLRLGNFTGNDADEWPRLYWYRDTANGWDEGLIKGNSTRGVFGKSHYGIHFDDSRSFGFHTSGWDTEMEINGNGLIYMKGQLMIGRTSEVSNAKLAVQDAAWFDSNSQSRVLYLEGGAENGNIIQFQRYGVNKWEVVGRDGTFYIYKNDGTGSGYKYQINTSGEHTITGVVTTTSTLRAQGDVIAYYSDMRLKTKIGDIQDPIGKIQALNGFYYEPNEVAESYGYEKERRIGLSAQEVKEVVPEAVHDAPIGDGYMAVDYAKLVPVLVEAIKEQQKQIEELKAMIK